MANPRTRANAEPPRPPEEVARLVEEGNAFITSEELRVYLGNVPMGTLDQWASRGGGPDFHKFGKYRQYHTADIRAWVKDKRRNKASAA